jgi:hypothetical protein
MADAEVDPLPIPPAAQKQSGVEVLRALVVEGKLEVALRRAFEEPDFWGLLIADVALHAARIFATETELSEEEALARIHEIFDAEIDSPTDPGSTNAVS